MIRIGSIRKGRMSNDELLEHRAKIQSDLEAAGTEQKVANALLEGIYIEMIFRNDRVL